MDVVLASDPLLGGRAVKLLNGSDSNPGEPQVYRSETVAKETSEVGKPLCQESAGGHSICVCSLRSGNCNLESLRDHRMQYLGEGYDPPLTSIASASRLVQIQTHPPELDGVWNEHDLDALAFNWQPQYLAFHGLPLKPFFLFRLA